MCLETHTIIKIDKKKQTYDENWLQQFCHSVDFLICTNNIEKQFDTLMTIARISTIYKYLFFIYI